MIFEVMSVVCVRASVFICVYSPIRDIPNSAANSIQTVLYLITPPVYQPGNEDKGGKTPVVCSCHCYPLRELYPDRPSRLGCFLNHWSCSWPSFFNLSGVMVPGMQLLFLTLGSEVIFLLFFLLFFPLNSKLCIGGNRRTFPYNSNYQISSR